jgi:hypothetical protein
VGDASPDRPAIANRGVTDELRCGSESGTVAGHEGILGYLHVACHRADLEHSVLSSNERKLGHLVDINEDLWTRQPKIHKRDEALSSCEHLRITFVTIQEVDAFADACRR